MAIDDDLSKLPEGEPKIEALAKVNEREVLVIGKTEYMKNPKFEKSEDSIHRLYVWHRGLRSPRKFSEIKTEFDKNHIRDVQVFDGGLYKAIEHCIYDSFDNEIRRRPVDLYDIEAISGTLFDMVVMEDASLLLKTLTNEPVCYIEDEIFRMKAFQGKLVGLGYQGLYELWPEQKPPVKYGFFGDLCVYKNKLYCLGDNNCIVDLHSGEKIWEDPSDKALDTDSLMFAMHNNKIYLCGMNNGIEVYDLKTGRTEKWFEEMGKIDLVAFVPSDIKIKRGE